MGKARNVFLFIVLLGVLAVNWAMHRDPASRNRDFLADMADSAAYESQAENSAVAGGNTALQPVAGTIARGFPPLRYAATPEDALRAGAELTNPFPANDFAALDRGAVVYGSYCAACHGPSGLGDGPVTTRGFPPPPSLAADQAVKMADGQMFHIITYGQRNMAAYAAQVAREDRWKAILHIRSLQQKQQAPASVAAAATLDPQAAKEVRQ
jgi:mono/diheme cytochrome c family protein